MKNIALAISGGGFRAAAFSLGSLSYLNHCKYNEQPLLHNVKFIGSTSGGSITNLMYTSGICNGKSFEQVYEKLNEVLSGEELLQKVFTVLKDKSQWKDRPGKSRNLINAFSMVYNEYFYQDQDFGVICDRIANTHLEEITVNSTEFTNGISFRFQTQHSNANFPRGRVGNNYIYFEYSGLAQAKKIKLGDILAASSCFSGGFEPIVFPCDFTHKTLTAKELTQNLHYKSNPFTVDHVSDKIAGVPLEGDLHFGLMDGGVADNQAIDSVLLANTRREKKGLSTFDLIVVTDVTSYFMDGYEQGSRKKTFFDSVTLSQVENSVKLTT